MTPPVIDASNILDHVTDSMSCSPINLPQSLTCTSIDIPVSGIHEHFSRNHYKVFIQKNMRLGQICKILN